MSTGTEPEVSEFHHAGISSGGIITVPIWSIQPAVVNDTVYKPIDTADPSFVAFARGIGKTLKDFGPDAIDPIVITLNGVIISGHRRYAAYLFLQLETVRVRVLPVRSDDARFEKLLVDFNSQREKSADEIFREELVRLDPNEARRNLIAHRKQAATVAVETLTITGTKRRAEITDAKRPMLDAIRGIVKRLKKFWPLSDRLIHYQLLNAPPLKHASKPGSKYVNDDKSYDALTELLARARLVGTIPHEAIHDPTRPVVTWKVYSDVRGFIKDQLKNFLRGYWRDLQRSQPLHIEVVGEKNTVEGTIRPVLADYTIPFTIARGYASIPPRRDMVLRFQRSKKDKLLILFVSDCDPEGEDIANSFARSIRDDFGVKNVEAVRVALTRQQATELHLPPLAKAKAGSSRRKRFVETHESDHVWELEAVPPDRLQQILREHIEGVLDMDLFHEDEAREADDAVELDEINQRMSRFLAANFSDLGECDGDDSGMVEFGTEGGDE